MAAALIDHVVLQKVAEQMHHGVKALRSAVVVGMGPVQLSSGTCLARSYLCMQEKKLV